jgi:hypothetical protein
MARSEQESGRTAIRNADEVEHKPILHYRAGAQTHKKMRNTAC